MTEYEYLSGRKLRCWEFSEVDQTKLVERWVEQVEELAMLVGWNDFQTLVAANRVLIDAAKE